jgi:hypothetical protein
MNLYTIRPSIALRLPAPKSEHTQHGGSLSSPPAPTIRPALHTVPLVEATSRRRLRMKREMNQSMWIRGRMEEDIWRRWWIGVESRGLVGEDGDWFRWWNRWMNRNSNGIGMVVKIEMVRSGGLNRGWWQDRGGWILLPQFDGDLPPPLPPQPWVGWVPKLHIVGFQLAMNRYWLCSMKMLHLVPGNATVRDNW